MVGGASDRTNHKLIGIGGLQQPESDSSHGHAAEAGEQQTMKTADQRAGVAGADEVMRRER